MCFPSRKHGLCDHKVVERRLKSNLEVKRLSQLCHIYFCCENDMRIVTQVKLSYRLGIRSLRLSTTTIVCC